MTDSVAARPIEITRVYDAPRALVWEAWTDPDRLAQWWGRRGWSADRASIIVDLRPGGTFRVTTRADDGREMTTAGVYREVVPFERLVFVEAGGGRGDATGTLALADLGDGRTEMTFTATIHATAALRDTAAGGMSSALDRLAEHLSGTIKSPPPKESSP